MQPQRTRTFRSGNSQAVRLPKALAFPDGQELEVTRTGDMVTLRPVTKPQTHMPLSEMIEALERLPKPDRVELRDTGEIPERPGL